MNEREPVPDNRLEEAWRAALQREQAPPEFAAGVLARLSKGAEAAVPEKRRVASFPRMRALVSSHKGLAHTWVRVALAAMLMLAFVLPVGYRLHRQAEVARGEAARQQVMLALRIAGTQLRSIEGRTQSIHIEAGILKGESQ